MTTKLSKLFFLTEIHFTKIIIYIKCRLCCVLVYFRYSYFYRKASIYTFKINQSQFHTIYIYHFFLSVTMILFNYIYKIYKNVS